jgi:putative zinc finger/helix-turn-helix YgiT family protein
MRAHDNGNCLECGRADLEPAVVTDEGTVRGENYTVSMQGLKCPNCGYETIEGEEMQEYGRLLADEYRRAHGLLTSTEIVALRNELGENQQQFADRIGVGVASIKRWELGKIQDKRNDELIRQKAKPVLHVGQNYLIFVNVLSTSGANCQIVSGTSVPNSGVTTTGYAYCYIGGIDSYNTSGGTKAERGTYSVESATALWMTPTPPNRHCTQLTTRRFS